MRSFFDSNGDGIGDFRGPGVEARLPAGPGRHGALAAAVLSVAAARRRLRHRRLHRRPPRLRHARRLRAVPRRGAPRAACASSPSWSSTTPPTSTPGSSAPAARRPGSVERDFYVWSDTPERYREARIIFKDFEPSNWAWDPVARAYFWHRFYAHQPDLNFENPAVHEALLERRRLLARQGRRRAAPRRRPLPLRGARGPTARTCPRRTPSSRSCARTSTRASRTACCSPRRTSGPRTPPPTSATATSATWTSTSRSCRGCSWRFTWRTASRSSTSWRRRRRSPTNCQWALFLRNHDELTLEMVTDEERDYMYRAYAHDSEMRINLGIRRRLAPLVGNDRRKMELLNGLLFSLPGTPVLYYGDEIGMGDNVYLGDRNGVRTPMQWSADRNAGFSRANPQRLILPIIIDPEYHYEAINVEAQQNNPNSLLWWTKRLIALRKQFQAFGRGTIEFLTPVQPPRAGLRARSYERRDRPGGRQPVALPAVRRAGPVEVEGDAPASSCSGTPSSRRSASCPTCSPWPGTPSTGSRSSRRRRATATKQAAAYVPPVLAGTQRATACSSATSGRRWRTRCRLPGHAPLVRRARLPRDARCRIEEAVALGGVFVLVVARSSTPIARPRRYVLPLATVDGRRAASPPHAIVAHAAAARRRRDARRRDGGRPRRRARCWRPSSARTRAAGSRGDGRRDAASSTLEVARGRAAPTSAPQHAAAAIRYGDRYLLKMFRRLEEGREPGAGARPLPRTRARPA